jgi:uncharacterized protein YndB with AHSA1/START domain
MTDSVKVETVVRTDPHTAFRVFTDEVDQWWKKRVAGGPMRFHDGKLMDGAFEVGRVVAWEPGVRLVFEWRTPAFAPGEKTEVEIRFEAEAGATRVTLWHRGWDSLADDHPARHGYRPKAGPAFRDMIGLSWAEQLTSYRGRF